MPNDYRLFQRLCEDTWTVGTPGDFDNPVLEYVPGENNGTYFEGDAIRICVTVPAGNDNVDGEWILPLSDLNAFLLKHGWAIRERFPDV